MSEMAKIYILGSKEIKVLLKRVLDLIPDFSGKSVLDFPAGSGESSEYLLNRGAQVLAWDAFPEFFKVPRLKCQFADLQKIFPAELGVFDYCLFQEGIEHLPNQLFALTEFHRVLKSDGKLFVTTPNYSNLRSRIAYLFFESETPKMFPPNEVDSIWFGKDNRVYYGHIFSLGIMRLRMLATLAGFRIHKIHPSRINVSSAALGLIFLPLIILRTTMLLLKYFRKFPQSKNVYSELYWLNLHPTVLFGGHLIVEMEKSSKALAFRGEKIERT